MKTAIQSQTHQAALKNDLAIATAALNEAKLRVGRIQSALDQAVKDEAHRVSTEKIQGSLAKLRAPK